MKLRTRFVAASLCCALCSTAHAQTAFTYQGRLTNAGAPAAGTTDLAFRLFDAANGGNQIGGEIALPGFSAFDAAGAFTATLDFGLLAFDGEARWLEIAVNGVPLSPRHAVRPAPYAIHAQTVGSVSSAALSGTYTNALQFSNAANQFNGAFTGVGSGLIGLNASNLASGTLASGRLSGTYTNTLTMSNPANIFTGSFAGSHSGSGAALTNLNAGNIASGNLNAARLPTGGNWSLSSVLNIGSDALVINAVNNRVGVGVASPLAPLHVESASAGGNVFLARAIVAGQTAGRFEGTESSNKAVWATVNGIASSAVFLDAAGEYSAAVFAKNTSTSGESYGAYIDADSPDGWAAYVLGSRSYFDGRIGVGESAPLSMLHVRAPDDAVGGPIVRLQGQVSNQAESGRVRFVENSSFQGMFIHYDGAGNRLHLGGHSLADSLVANDRSHMVIERDSGHVGVGLADPNASLHVEGTSTDVLLVQANAGGQRAGRFIASAGSSRGVWATVNGDTSSAVYAESSGALGAAVVAHDNAVSGESYGVYATSDSPDGFAGYFIAPTVGVYGRASSEPFDVNYGVYGESASQYGNAVFGKATSTIGSSAAGRFEATSNNGRAVHAIATADNGVNYGLRAETNSPSGYAGYFLGPRNFFNGRVGIGQTQPDAELHVAGIGGGNADLLLMRNDASHGFNFGVSSTPMLFISRSDGTTYNDYLSIDGSSGEVGIGTTNPSFLLHVNGTAGKPGGGSWSVASDARLKHNVQSLQGSLDRLLALRGVTFEYRDPDAVHELHGVQTGFIAQEVQQVFPEWVEQASDGYLRLSERGTTAHLVEALRQLRDEKDAQIADLQQQIEELRQLITSTQHDR